MDSGLALRSDPPRQAEAAVSHWTAGGSQSLKARGGRGDRAAAPPRSPGSCMSCGATRAESVGHELPRRRPVERQSDVGPDAALYPGMMQWLDRSSYQAVSGSSDIVLETISLPIEDQAHMPVIRDLSATRWAMIHAWLKNGCSEGGSDA